TAALSFLLMAIVAIALAAMAASFSAGLCTIRYDILPERAETTTAGRAGRLFFLAVLGALVGAAELLAMGFTDPGFLALVLALGAPVLSLETLVFRAALGPPASATRGLLTLASAPVVTGTALAAFIVTRNDMWLWLAVPLSLFLAVLIE